MDKALPSGGRDCGFESRLGLFGILFAEPGPLAVVCGLRCSGAKLLAAPPTRGGRKKGGDARIELATSCTLSKNHTTRPITHIRTRGMDNESKNAFIQRGCRARRKKKVPTPPRPRPRTKKECTACGDRTRDQSIKSRTLYLTELRRPVVDVLPHRFLHFVASVGVGQWVSDRSYIQEVLLTACSGHMVSIYYPGIPPQQAHCTWGRRINAFLDCFSGPNRSDRKVTLGDQGHFFTASGHFLLEL
jgi:hypothetical protein